MLADKKDLIRLKKLRESKQNHADIEMIEDDPDRKVLKELCELYGFNRNIKAYDSNNHRKIS